MDEIKCLDHGFVRLIDHMGNDQAVVQAARVSYGEGTKAVSKDRALIRYLMRHDHTSPFEMVEFKFHCKMPIFVARQWIRHRTANVNEVSGRYSVMPKEKYFPTPEDIAYQSDDNKQGRGIQVSNEVLGLVSKNLKDTYRQADKSYEEMLDANVARELARINLPLATYTEWYWKIDLHNLLHFLKLRLHPHAQKEIRTYALAMAKLVKPLVPLTWKAFEDYKLNSYTLSKKEVELVKSIMGEIPESFLGMTEREMKEFKKVFKK